MFEAIHGSAPRRAGQNVANPSGLLLASVQMLVHIGQPEVASSVHNAWLRTLEQGIHTYDIFKEGVSKQKVGTQEFAQAVVKNLGKKPETLQSVAYHSAPPPLEHRFTSSTPQRQLAGLDVFIFFKGSLEQFFAKVSHMNIGSLRLAMISNRGVRVWPGGQPETFCIEQWRCRFLSDDLRPTTQRDAISILQAFDHVQLDVIKSEFLYLFDGKPGYSSSEG